MAEYGEWTRKGASLSDTTAKKEYGVDRDFILKGIRADKLEYQEGNVWGSPYLKLLRRQLEQYISEELGATYLSTRKSKEEQRKIKREIVTLKNRLKKLEAQKTELEQRMKINHEQ